MIAGTKDLYEELDAECPNCGCRRHIKLETRKRKEWKYVRMICEHCARKFSKNQRRIHTSVVPQDEEIC